jgi:hypothetical protein
VRRSVSRSSSKESLPRGDGAGGDIVFMRIDSSPEDGMVIGEGGGERKGEVRLRGG